MNDSNDEEGENKKATWWYNDVWCVKGDLKNYIDLLLMIYHGCVKMDYALIWKFLSSHYSANMPICIGSKTLWWDLFWWLCRWKWFYQLMIIPSENGLMCVQPSLVEPRKSMHKHQLQSSRGYTGL